jgi:hypothetical protein
MKKFVAILLAATMISSCHTVDGITKKRFTPAPLSTLQDRACYLLPGDPLCKVNASGNNSAKSTEDQIAARFEQLHPLGEAAGSAIRKDYAEQLLQESDVICDQYMRRLKGRDAILTYALGVVGLAFTTAGGIATPVSSAHILTGVGGVSNGANTQVETAVLDSNHFDLISIANFQGRTKERTTLQGVNYADESLITIRNTISAYNAKCGIDYAVTYIAQTVTPPQTSPPPKLPPSPTHEMSNGTSNMVDETSDTTTPAKP